MRFREHSGLTARAYWFGLLRLLLSMAATSDRGVCGCSPPSQNWSGVWLLIECSKWGNVILSGKIGKLAYSISMKHPRSTFLNPHGLQQLDLGIFHEEEEQEEGLLGLREDSPRSEPAEQTARCSRSSNHNFQKHAVVTIRKLLKPNWRRGGPGAEGVAHEMWNIFLASGLKSKKLLVVLFGEVDFSDGACRALLQRCGFEETLAYEEQVVREAQSLLRERLVNTLEDSALPHLLANRNISKPAEFTAYFRELLAALRQGPLLKLRIDERTAQRIRASAP